MVTDYLLAVATAIWGIGLLESALADGEPSRALWGVGFLASSLGAALGGTVHGFAPRMGKRVRSAVWLVTLSTVAFAGLALFGGAVLADASRDLRPWLLLAGIVKTALFGYWVAAEASFRYVVLDYSLSMIAVVAVELSALARGASDAAPWILAGIALSLLAARVQRAKWRLGRHLGHNDLFHLVQLGAFYFLYVGGLSLSGR
jgi:hypothetical protein